MHCAVCVFHCVSFITCTLHGLEGHLSSGHSPYLHSYGMGGQSCSNVGPMLELAFHSWQHEVVFPAQRLRMRHYAAMCTCTDPDA